MATSQFTVINMRNMLAVKPDLVLMAGDMPYADMYQGAWSVRSPERVHGMCFTLHPVFTQRVPQTWFITPSCIDNGTMKFFEMPDSAGDLKLGLNQPGPTSAQVGALVDDSCGSRAVQSRRCLFTYIT